MHEEKEKLFHASFLIKIKLKVDACRMQEDENNDKVSKDACYLS